MGTIADTVRGRRSDGWQHPAAPNQNAHLKTTARGDRLLQTLRALRKAEKQGTANYPHRIAARGVACSVALRIVNPETSTRELSRRADRAPRARPVPCRSSSRRHRPTHEEDAEERPDSCAHRRGRANRHCCYSRRDEHEGGDGCRSNRNSDRSRDQDSPDQATFRKCIQLFGCAQGRVIQRHDHSFGSRFVLTPSRRLPNPASNDSDWHRADRDASPSALSFEAWPCATDRRGSLRARNSRLPRKLWR